MKKKILLCILDGWGIGKKNSCNAIHLAKKKNFDFILKKFNSSKLHASENHVGLPKGQFGNSEVGHMNIGAGRILMQDIMRIDKSFKDGLFEKKSLIKSIKKNCKRLHIIGVLSDGGVHGHQDHIFHLIDIFSKTNLEILLHCILDGRDSSPLSGLENLEILKKKIYNLENFKIASVSGRYYVMDRDNRWDRIHKAYNAIIEGEARHSKDCIEEVKRSYKNKITDEFFEPLNFNNYNGVCEGDGFFLTNFRADRVREFLTSVFEENFEFFKRRKKGKFYKPVSMVEYSKRLKKFIQPIFSSRKIINSLGEVIAQNGLKQLRIAETEKYAHVTYFFNGGVEREFSGEDRILVPSPRVKTYDKKPEMSAFEMTEILKENIKKNKYDIIVSNFANPDMVGHSGDITATVKAIETVDDCLGKILKECEYNNYTLIVTSDHGNADEMFDKSKSEPITCHSTNQVPFIICDKVFFSKNNGCLADIAPTILKMIGIDQPPEMTGVSLIK